MNKQVKQYHESRRMFYISTEGEIIFAPKNSSMSHSEWFETIEPKVRLEEVVRGVVQSNGIFFYIGDFQTDSIVEMVARKYYRSIIKECLLKDTIKVYAGLIKSKPGLLWRGKTRIA